MPGRAHCATQMVFTPILLKGRWFWRGRVSLLAFEWQTGSRPIPSHVFLHHSSAIIVGGSPTVDGVWAAGPEPWNRTSRGWCSRTLVSPPDSYQRFDREQGEACSRAPCTGVEETEPRADSAHSRRRCRPCCRCSPAGEGAEEASGAGHWAYSEDSSMGAPV